MSARRIECDVAIVGAGPAGLAAASVCARAGLATLVIDENASPGGHATHEPQHQRLVDEFAASGALHQSRSTAWSLSPDLDVAFSTDGVTTIASARSVILATGAIERPCPIAGATLAGVTTIGAARSRRPSGFVPAGRTVVAGSGPLLWMATGQLLAAGAAIAAVLDTTPHENRSRALPHLPGFLFSSYVGRALRMLLAVRGHVPIVPAVTELRASGTSRLESVAYRTANGDGGTLPADTLLLHQGVVPETHLAMAAGVAHQWDPLRLCWAPVVDRNGGTSVAGVLVTGDAAGIGGAQVAAWRGVLSAIAIVESLQPGRKLHHARLARTAIAQLTRGRRFFDTLYRPALRFRVPPDDAVACPCEGVAAGEIRAAVDEGCVGPNQAKAFTRCGMGPCQGRMCGLTVTEIIAQRRGMSPADVGHFTARFPARPVTLAEVASLPHGEAAIAAVVR